MKPECFSFGLLLSWFLLAFGQGLCNPIAQKGYLVGVVAITFISAGLSLLWVALSSSDHIRILDNKAITVTVSAVAAAASVILSLAPIAFIPSVFMFIAALLVGPCAAWLLLLCGRSYIGLERDQLFFSIFATVFIVFVAYFSAVSLPRQAQPVVFALLPLLASLLLTVGPVIDRGAVDSESKPAPLLTPIEDALSVLPARSLRVKILVSFSIYFFTISVIRSANLFNETSTSEFSDGMDIALVITSALILIILLINRLSNDYSNIFVRGCYVVAAIVEVFIIIPISLGVQGDAEVLRLVHAVIDSTFFMTVLIAWYCVAVDVTMRNRTSAKAFGFAFGVWALAAGLGWVVQNVLEWIIYIPNFMLLLLVSNAIIRLACFLFIFPDTALMRFISVPVPQVSEIEGNAQQDFSQPRLLSFKATVEKLSVEADLSPREQEILLLLAKGRSNQNIAEELVLSFHTVRAHVRNAYSKLNIHSRQELLDLIERSRK